MPERITSRAVAAAFFAVGALGIGSFALAIKTFPDRLKAPFGLISAAGDRDASGEFSGSSGPVNDFLLDAKDTDRDGIPDAQELRIYQTSPFLEDSDSDGISDKDEIDNSTNPNCPEGTDCRNIFDALPSVREVQKERIAESLYDASIISKLEETGIPGITDAASIRDFLKQSGVPNDILAQFDDQALLEIYRNTEKDDSASPRRGEESINDNPGQLPESPSPDEIRALLEKGGANRVLIEAFTDEQLLELYREVLADIRAE